MSKHAVDLIGRLWRSDDSNNFNEHRDAIATDWKQVDNIPALKNNSSVRIFGNNRRYTLTADGNIFDLKTYKTIQHGNLFIERIVECQNWYYILTHTGDLLTSNDTKNIIMSKVKFIGPAGRDKILIGSSDETWHYLQFQTDFNYHGYKNRQNRYHNNRQNRYHNNRYYNNRYYNNYQHENYRNEDNNHNQNNENQDNDNQDNHNQENCYSDSAESVQNLYCITKVNSYETHPTGDVISQRGCIIRTTHGCWILDNTGFTKLPVNDDILDVVMEGYHVDSYKSSSPTICAINKHGKALYVYQDRTELIDNTVIQIMHNYYSQWEKIYYHFDPISSYKSGLMLCNRLGELYKFACGSVSYVDIYPKEMFICKWATPKSAAYF